MRRSLVALLLVAACGGGTTASTTTITPPTTQAPTTTTQPQTPRDRELQGLLDEWAADNDPVGIAAAVLYPDGDLWLGAAGLADREAGIPVLATDRFEVASVTKIFMSALTLRLVEEGLVTLDEPIATWLPDFPEADRITVRNLLGHRAGVHDPSSQLVSDRFGPPDYEKVFTPAELLDAAAAGSPAFEPGSRHDYSNANYWVLAAVLEEATGEGIGTLLETRVFDPLGLEDTVLFDDSLPEVVIVNAYTDLDLDGDPDPMGTAPLPGLVTPAWTAGGIISTPADLVRFLDALFAGRVLNAASLEEMLDTIGGGSGYALGIYNSNGRWGHDGGIPGFLSALFHDERSGVTMAVLTNRFGPDAPQADAFLGRLAALARQFAP